MVFRRLAKYSHIFHILIDRIDKFVGSTPRLLAASSAVLRSEVISFNEYPKRTKETSWSLSFFVVASVSMNTALCQPMPFQFYADTLDIHAEGPGQVPVPIMMIVIIADVGPGPLAGGGCRPRLRATAFTVTNSRPSKISHCRSESSLAYWPGDLLPVSRRRPPYSGWHAPGHPGVARRQNLTRSPDRFQELSESFYAVKKDWSDGNLQYFCSQRLNFWG